MGIYRANIFFSSTKNFFVTVEGECCKNAENCAKTSQHCRKRTNRTSKKESRRDTESSKEKEKEKETKEKSQNDSAITNQRAIHIREDQSENKQNDPSLAENNDENNDEGDGKDEPPPVGNGGTTDKYIWTQILEELTVNIPVPAGTRGKHMIVDLDVETVKVQIKGQDPN